MGENDQFVLKFNARGQFQWIKQIPGEGAESRNLVRRAQADVSVLPMGLAYNPSTGGLHLAGDFSSVLILEINYAISTHYHDGFIAKLEGP